MTGLRAMEKRSQRRPGVIASACVRAPAPPWCQHQTRTPGQPVRAFYAEGKLVADGDCIRLERSDVVELVTPVWPAGYTSRRTPNGVEVLAPNGTVIARSGEDIHLSRGYASPSFDSTSSCAPPSHDHLYLVEQDLMH